LLQDLWHLAASISIFTVCSCANNKEVEKHNLAQTHTHRQHCTLRAHRVFAIARSEEEQVGITIALITKALLSEAGFGKVFRTRIGSIDDFVSCWGKRGAYLVLLEPS
jgi:hypothetical protein